MNRIILMVFISTTLLSRGNIECISLGEVCSVAGALRTFKLRRAAYPFDWLVSLFPALYSSISDDFKDYLNPMYLKVVENNRRVMNKYGISFAHDFPTVHTSSGINIEEVDRIGENTLSPEWLKSLPLVQNKYRRRINRFMEKCNSDNKIYFFRHFGMDQRSAIQLKNLIELKYPTLDFVLVVVGNSSVFAKQWGYLKIRNYYLDGWGDAKRWKMIFSDLGILPKYKSSASVEEKRYEESLCGHCYYCQRRKSQIV